MRKGSSLAGQDGGIGAGLKIIARQSDPGDALGIGSLYAKEALRASPLPLNKIPAGRLVLRE